MSLTDGAHQPPSLCIDLDGTLLLGDVGIESALALAKRNPLYLLTMLIWLLQGFAVLKREIARRVSLDPRTLPYDERVLQWVEAQRRSRPCLLVTASDALLAQPIADHLGCFDGVMASNGKVNLAASAKAHALVERFGERGFDYAGNSGSDLAVWPHAQTVIVANASPRLLRQAAKLVQIGRVFPRQGHFLRTWAQALRLHQWVKNLLVFVPLLGAHLLSDGQRVLQAATAWLLFGFCTSGTYLINDLLDLSADRSHPQKRYRSLASGRLALQDGLIAAPVLIAGALLAATMILAPEFLLWLLAYLALTLLYSLRLKRIIFLDTLVLAALFTLRIVAGGAATSVPVSPWLLSLSMLGFLGLALLKRYTELNDLRSRNLEQVNGRGYRGSHLNLVCWLGIIAGVATIVLLGFYIESPTSHALYQRQGVLWLLCPLLSFWMARLWWLAKDQRMHDDPIMFATRDISSWIVMVLGGVITWVAI